MQAQEIQGFVDTTLNDGFTTNKDLENYKKLIFKVGIKAVKKFIKEYQVDCDWNELCTATSKKEDNKFLSNFSKYFQN